jgi:hypothetical protein
MASSTAVSATYSCQARRTNSEMKLDLVMILDLSLFAIAVDPGQFE